MVHPRFIPGRRTTLAAGVADSGPFAPSDINGLSLWLDASDSDTITLSGSDVTTWADKSGAGNTVTAASNRPSIAVAQQNGLDGIFFDTNEWLTKASPSTSMMGNVTVFFVVENESNTADRVLCSIGGLTTDLSWEVTKSTSYQFRAYSSINGVAFNAMVSSTNVCPIAAGALYGYFYHGAADADLFWDGGTVSGTANTKNVTSADFVIGGNEPYWSDWYGYAYEFLVYDSILSAANQSAVVAYLEEKWGL